MILGWDCGLWIVDCGLWIVKAQAMFVVRKKLSGEGATAQRLAVVQKAAGMLGFFVVLRFTAWFLQPRQIA